MIYYFCYENPSPTGGNKIAYRHAELLNEMGFEAAIVHNNQDFRYTQFVHQPPVVGLKQLRLTAKDIFVLPEDLGPVLNRIAPGIRKVIFNQNAYNTFRQFSLADQLLPPYLHPEYLATFVVSEDNRIYLESAFPGLRCKRLHISFRSEIFQCTDLSQKKRQICFMTRKNAADVNQVLLQLHSRGHLKGWAFKAIENASEQAVAEVMRESALFLAFGHPEGISLSNIEAMASACRVVGYSGMGCREYFRTGYCQEISFGDITAFVAEVERLAHEFDSDRGTFNTTVKRAQSYAMRTFSVERERADLLEAFTDLVT